MIKVLAAAKVNLALDVLHRREDGYHQVDFIMQSVGIYDELTFREGDGFSLAVSAGAPAGESNLVAKAAKALSEAAGYPMNACIALTKNIPEAAGLGGGSADAAAALLALNELWQLRMPMQQLLDIGASLGADIPFCMTGGTARATGIGTQLAPLPPPPPFALLVHKPCEGVSTKAVYQSLRVDRIERRPDIPRMIAALRAGNLAEMLAGVGNALESVTCAMRPQVAEAIERMQGVGALCACMSGSGPAVFGAFPDEEAAREASIQYGGGTVCAPVDAGVLLCRVDAD